MTQQKELPSQYLTSRSTKSSKRHEADDKTAPIEFSLFAPYNEKVALKGDFSDWKELELTKGDDGYFRTTLDLADGDYEYKFCVKSNSPWWPGEWVCITDPMATDVNEEHDENGILHVREGQTIVDQYQWQHDDAFLPPDNELVIYEMHISDFGGNFQGVIEKLDYLASLGVNGLELMPLAEYPGKYSWGYNPKFFYAVESAYGTSTDFKHLVDECHARGIRVILDVVANHTHQDSPLAHIDHNYWFMDPEQNTDNEQFGPKFDYNHLDENLGMFPARKFMNEVAFYWATEFHLDGIRFDATSLINNFDFLRFIGEKVKEVSGMKPFYLVAEHIPLDPAIVGMDGPMDGLWHDYFYFQMVANLRENDFNGTPAFDWERTMAAIEPARNAILGPIAAVQYLTNHDHERLMFELGAAGIVDEKAFRKAKLGAAVLFTSVGVPMIWMGEEFGEFWEKSLDAHPLHWDLLGNENNSDLLHYYSGLVYLRKTTDALKTENIEFFHHDPEHKLMAWRRWDEGGSLVAVVANFSDEPLGDYSVPFFPSEDGGQWHEFTFNYDIQTAEGVLVDSFGPSECKIYIKK